MNCDYLNKFRKNIFSSSSSSSSSAKWSSSFEFEFKFEFAALPSRPRLWKIMSRNRDMSRETAALVNNLINNDKNAVKKLNENILWHFLILGKQTWKIKIAILANFDFVNFPCFFKYLNPAVVPWGKYDSNLFCYGTMGSVWPSILLLFFCIFFIGLQWFFPLLQPYFHFWFSVKILHFIVVGVILTPWYSLRN